MTKNIQVRAAGGSPTFAHSFRALRDAWVPFWRESTKKEVLSIKEEKCCEKRTNAAFYLISKKPVAHSYQSYSYERKEKKIRSNISKYDGTKNG